MSKKIYESPNKSTPKRKKIINANLSVPFQLKVNQLAKIKSENIKIKFLNVTEDSRCPSDVQCVWAGQVTIVFQVYKNEQKVGNFSLSSLTKPEITVGGYSIKLTNVISAPKSSGQPIEISDYVVTLVVSKI